MRFQEVIRTATICLCTLGAPLSTPAATWYVSPTGSDQNPGAAEAPFRTVQHAVNVLQPGDVLIIRPGIYREAIVIERGGSPDLPIQIVAEPGAILLSPEPAASLSAIDVRGSAGHLVLDGIEATGGYHETLFLRPGSHDVAVRACSVHGNRSGLWVAGAERVRVEDCIFAQNSAQGVRVFQQSRAITFLRTQAVGNDDGLGCSGDADGFSVSSDSEWVLFEDCIARSNGEDGFDLQAATTVRRSVSTDNGCAGFKFFRGGIAENVLSARNRLGISSTTTTVPPHGLAIESSTIADNSDQQVLVRNAATSGPTYLLRVHNSILSGPGKALEVQGNVALDESFNLFFRPDTTDPLIVLPGTDAPRTFSGQAINAGLYRAATGLGRGTFAMEPRFDSSASDYRLSSASPAIDLADPATSGGVDLWRRARPLGLRNDLGATESGFSAPNHAPWPDAGPPRTIIAGTWFRLSAYGSVDPDGDTLLYRWTVDPNLSPLTGFQIRYAFPLPGLYSVLLDTSDGLLTSSRTLPLQVVYPPSTHSAHDSSVVAPPPATARLRSSSQVQKTVRIRVRNEDGSAALEPVGHLVRLHVEPGTCPAGTIISAPDFEPRLAGSQDVALVRPGRARTARVVLLLSAAAAPSCSLVLRAETIHPGNTDPNPVNDSAPLELRVH